VYGEESEIMNIGNVYNESREDLKSFLVKKKKIEVTQNFVASLLHPAKAERAKFKIF
jgi:hypothetical protein